MAPAPQTGTPVPSERTIMRVVSKKKPFFTDDDPPAPSWSQFFRPSTEDASRAPVRVSVWDCVLTTDVAQVVRIRAVKNLSLRQQLFAVLTRDVAAVILMARDKSDGIDGVAVVYESIEDEELRSMPGADGHAGIEGLGSSRNGKPFLTPAQKSFLDDLARACDLDEFRLPDSDPAPTS